MKPTNKLRAISEQALKNLTTRHTRLVPTQRSLPDPQMLKDFLQLDLPLSDPRTRRLDHAADIWDLRAIAKRRTPQGWMQGRKPAKRMHIVPCPRGLAWSETWSLRGLQAFLRFLYFPNFTFQKRAATCGK